MTAKKRFAFSLGLLAVLALGIGAALHLPVHAAAEACVAGPHHGTISADQAWCLADSPHVLDNNVTVASGATLTIEAGAVVYVQSGYYLEVYDGASFVAQGTAEYPITFTSSAATPQPGDWANLWFREGSHGRLEHVDIGYAGYGWSVGLYVDASDVEVRDSRVHHTAGDGVQVMDGSTGALFDGVQIDHSSGRAVYQYWLDSDTSYQDVTLSDNGMDALVVEYASLSHDVTLDASASALNGSPARILTNIKVHDGTTLTVAPGSLVQMASGIYADVYTGGTLLVQGTVEEPITFTSPAAAAQAGDWACLWFYEGAHGRLEHVDIGYAGSGWDVALHVKSSDVEVRRSRIHHTAGDAIQVAGEADPVVEYNQIDSNEFGLRNLNSAAWVDARQNYWGDATGPYNAAANPGGLGNGVSDRVYFAPWYSDFEWGVPYASLLHAVERLGWRAFGETAGITVDLALRGAGDWQSLASGLPPNGSLDWDTAGVPDGYYDLRLRFLDSGSQLLAERIRRVLVLNGAGLQFHAGPVTANETWSAGVLHLVSENVTLGSGVQVTVEAGAIVKAAPDAGLIVPDGATLQALGTGESPIVLTSLLDDTAGGDTNLDGDKTLPRPGDWPGLVIDGSGVADLSQYTELRYAQVLHSGTLGGNAVWPGGLLHVVGGEVTVPSGVTLTIEPGAVVKFGPYLGITVQAGGHLVAQGTVAEPVVLTSLRDDTVGGDTNRDADLSAPAAGDWRGLLADGGQIVLDHALIAYGAGVAGGAWNETACSVCVRSGGTASLSNSLVREAFFDGLIAWGSGSLTASSSLIVAADRGVNADGSSTVQLTNCTLDDNRVGVWGHGGTLQVRNTIIAHSLEAGLDNILHSPLTWRYNDVWSATGADYVDHPDQTGLNGNISIDPELKDPAGGIYRLGYASPAIDAADGVAAPTTDFMGAPRYDDPRTPNTGLPAPGGAYADMGAFEFVETAQSNIDLVVTEVRGPLSAMAGENAAVTWTVANLGSEAAIGPWHDTVALAPVEELTPTLLVAAEVLAGEGVTLGPGATVEVETTVRVPGGMLGDYYWYVQANTDGEVFEGQNLANNLGRSEAAAALDVPELPVDGAAVAGRFGAAGEPHWFRFRWDPGQDVRVALDSQAASGAVELYLARSMPSRQEYEARSGEWNSPDASVVAAGVVSGTYYVLAYPNSLPGGPSEFSIQAASLDFSVSFVAPTTVGNAGLVTLEIRGGQLVSGTLLSLVAGNGAEEQAVRATFVDSSRAYATFDLTGFPAGPADVEAESGGATAVAPGAVQVQAGGSGEFYAELTGPSALRQGRRGTWYITYGNRGLVDVALPLLQFTVPQAQEMVLYESVENWADSVVLLALDREVLLPTLGPGQGETLPVEVLPGGGQASVQATLGMLDGEAASADETAFHWDEIPVPPGVDPADWQAELDSLGERLGETVGEYYGLLMDDLAVLAGDRLPYAYVVNADGRWLFGPEPWGVPEIQMHSAATGQAPDRARAEAAPMAGGPAAAGDGIPRTWHIVIMSAEYQDPKGNLPGVPTQHTDVMNLVEQTLRTPKDQVVDLFDDIGKSGDTLTSAGVLNAIKNLKGKVDGDDNLVVWYNGHGVRVGGNSALYLHGGDTISPSQLGDAFDTAAAGRTMFVNDSCYAGGFDINPSQTTLLGMYACEKQQRSWGRDRSGGILTTDLKAGIRNDKSLLQSFLEARTKICDEFKGKVNLKDRQCPTWWNPRGIQVPDLPWEDPTGFGSILGARLGLPNYSTVAEGTAQIVGSFDPNDKVGPAGASAQAYVGFDPLLAYTVHFENRASASAPAQQVVVTDVLDPEFDLSSLELTRIAFNDAVVDIPPHLDHYEATVQVGSDPNPVRVAAALDVGTRTITWTVWSVDPATGELPEDPFAGFLPPNNTEHRGEGLVSFTVRPMPGLPQGTDVRNRAKIVFDVNPPISTNEVLNTIGVGEEMHGLYLPLVLRRY